MYGVDEDRPFWKVYGLSIFMSLAVVVLLVGALVLVVFGASIGVTVADLVGLGAVFATVWGIAQWPVVACVRAPCLLFDLLFRPRRQAEVPLDQPRRHPRVRVLAGLLAAVLALRGRGSSFSATYGSLAGVIVLMLYVYYSALIMLVGAEMNQVIERHIPGGKDEGEKSPKPTADRTSTNSTANSTKATRAGSAGPA